MTLKVHRAPENCYGENEKERNDGSFEQIISSNRLSTEQAFQ